MVWHVFDPNIQWPTRILIYNMIDVVLFA